MTVTNWAPIQFIHKMRQIVIGMSNWVYFNKESKAWKNNFLKFGKWKSFDELEGWGPLEWFCGFVRYFNLLSTVCCHGWTIKKKWRSWNHSIIQSTCYQFTCSISNASTGIRIFSSVRIFKNKSLLFSILSRDKIHWMAPSRWLVSILNFCCQSNHYRKRQKFHLKIADEIIQTCCRCSTFWIDFVTWSWASCKA